MQDIQRKIHKLRVIAQDENTLSPNVNALQDAFNIASFPGLPPNGLLLIKKFDLGIFKSHSTSLMISRLIDKKIQDISYQAVCVDDDEYPQHNVVWFSDQAQAVSLLVKLIIKQNQPQAWYWPVLFPSWRAGMKLADVLPVISKDFKQQEIKHYVMAGVIQQLLAEGQPDTVLAAITPQLAQQLLYEAGIYPHLIMTALDEQVQLREKSIYMQNGWPFIISKAVYSWGKEDVRTIWLTYSALIKYNPALCENRQLLNLVVAFIDDIQNDYSLSDYSRLNKAGAEQKEKSYNAQKNSVGSVQLLAKKMESTFKSIKDNPLYANQKTTLENGKNFGKDASSNEVESMKNKSVCSVSTNYSGFVSSEYCGLAFLISLLELLSIRKFLLLNPLLAELNFPAGVIRVVAQRFGILNEHPVLQSLPELQEMEDKIVGAFISPDNWESLIFPPQSETNFLYLFNVKGDDRACYITDRTKKLLLYAGDRDKQQYPSWVKGHEIKRQPGVYAQAKIKDLENTLQLLSSRYLYRYARIGLRQLLNRKGFMAVTKTHIDILYDNKQIDHRIRFAGLDVNPGWVFWLARVVQFHYDSEVHVNA